MKLFFVNLIFFLLYLPSLKALESYTTPLIADPFSDHNMDFSNSGKYIFSEAKLPETKGEFIEKMAIYRGIIYEGETLLNRCKELPNIAYYSKWEEAQTKRELSTLLQYHILDLTVSAIASLLKEKELEREDYYKFVNNLVTSSCSNNLSIISHKELMANFKARFHNKQILSASTVAMGPLFAKELSEQKISVNAKDQKLLMLIKLFQVGCSFGGDVDNMRLLPLLTQDPTIMAIINRLQSGKKLHFIPTTNQLSLKNDLGLQGMKCNNLVCRTAVVEHIQKDLYKSIGFKNFQDDFDRLYCHRFRTLNINNREQSKRIGELIKSISLDEEYLLRSLFISLYADVPDFLITAQTFSEIKHLSRAGIDQFWNEWAEKKLGHLSDKLFYEEPLTVERLDRQLDRNDYRLDFKIMLDVNLGELDRINQRVGKIKVMFPIKLMTSYLAWQKREWANLDPEFPTRKDELVRSFTLQVEDQIAKGQKYFVFPPWEGDLSSMIVDDLLEQIRSYKGKELESEKDHLLTIPVEFYYAPFALSYMKYQHDIKRIEQSEKNRFISIKE